MERHHGSGHAPTPEQVVAGNRWDLLQVPTPGAWTPTRRLSVVLPHYEARQALEVTLAALAEQTYPRELVQVMVADDGSSPPLELPERHRGLDVTVVHQEDRGFGLARARNTGAAAADGDVLIFLDGDMAPEPGHLEAHARWHHVCGHAVTLGFRKHVEFGGVGPDEVASAARAGALASLFDGREVSEPVWLERHMTRMAELTADHDDLFRATTGGNLGVRAELFHAVGGFDATFRQWGSEDTDIGHRLFLAGALFVPERLAACWHQGDSGGLESHERRSLDQQRARISQTVPHHGFRRTAPGRSFRIPRVLVELKVEAQPHAAITGTLESVLACELHDLEILLTVPEAHPERIRLLREWAGDARIVTEERPGHARTPYRVLLPIGASLRPDAMDRLVATMTDPAEPTGVLRIELGDGQAADVTATRALARARLIGAEDERTRAGELFGARTIAGAALGLAWAPVTELARVPGPRAAATTAPTTDHASRTRSTLGPWLLVDTPLGWFTRGAVGELLGEADRRVDDAEQAATLARHDAEVARHEAALARYERDVVRDRRAVRVVTELANTAGKRSVRSLPTRLRAATEARPAAVPPSPPAAGAPPGTSSDDATSAPRSRVRPNVRALDERGLLPPRPARPAPFPHLRVLHLGAAGRFLSLADHTALTPETWREQLRSGADLVLVEPPAEAPGWDPLGGELPGLLRAASELGIASVRLATPSSTGVPRAAAHDSPGTPTLDLVEGPIGTAARDGLEGGYGRDDDTVFPTIDTSVLNPVGWSAQPPDPVVAVLQQAPDADARRLLSSFDPPVVLVHPTDLPAVGDELGIRRSVSSPAGLKRALVRAGVLLDHPAWRGDAAETLRTWSAALACGTPVVVVDDDGPAGGTALGAGTGTGELITADGHRLPILPGMLVVAPDDGVEVVHRVLTDPDLRERLGIVGRRWALRHGSREALLRSILDRLDVPVPGPARTTVLLATNRPDYVGHGLDSVVRQTQPGVDVSLVLHGSAFDDVDLPDRRGLVSSVVRAPDHWVLGDCLNAALDRADGELIAKMDDDDHYGPEHLGDLVAAWGYSGADLVGKRVEYVHLAERGITLRRPTSPPERDRPHVGGPTLFGARETLRRHRFLRVPNRVDSTLYERVLADGGRIYGIHSRDLVLERHGHGHAWQAADEGFLADAIDQRKGLAIDLATSDPANGA